MSLLGYSPLVWAAVAGSVALAAFTQARSRFGLLWAAVAVLAAQPRLLWYDFSYLALDVSHQELRPGWRPPS